jgi:hypothetical protein
VSGSSQRWTLWAVVLLVGLALGYYFSNSPGPTDFQTTRGRGIVPSDHSEPSKIGDVNSLARPTRSAIETSSDSNLTDQALIQVERDFVTHLTELSRCLDVKVTLGTDQMRPSLGNLFESVEISLGQTVVEMEDWTQTDVRQASGELQRIRVESEYSTGSASPTKRLQLFALDERGYPQMQSLDSDKTTNPNPAYLDSLKQGAKVLLDERAGRAYFQEGEELVYVERNGLIESVSLTKGERSFNCTGLDRNQSSCQCL